LTSTALLCLRDRGSAKYASAVIDLARRDLRRDILANAIMTLSDWSKSDDTLNGAIAELQGMHGNLIRWRATGPVPADERLKTIDLLNKSMAHPKRQGHFFFGIGDRVELSRNVNPKTPLWFAQTDVTVPTATSVEFLGASGGSFEVFLNGKSIHRRAKPAKFQTDSDRFNATLEKGVNYVLVQTGESLVVEFGLHFRRKSSKAEHEKLSLAALSRAGNAERGRKIFFDKEKAQCIKCHRMDDQGERIGPELTGVGARFSRIHIIESILEPSRTIAPSFGTYAIALKSGKTLSGVKLAETETAVTLADNQGVKHELSKRDIDEMNLSAVSTMPDGLEQRLTVDEFVDLIGFLASQKEKGTVRIR
jgi:putative heme-binding domain-containing protein